jgi:hypothetical protein
MRLFTTILAAISCLLLTLVVFFWIRSYFRYEGMVWYGAGREAHVVVTNVRGQRGEGEAPGRMRGLMSRGGSLTYASIADPSDEPESNSWSHPTGQPPKPGAMSLMYPTTTSGFYIGSGINRVADHDLNWELPFWRITVPYGLLALLFAIGPFLWFRSYREAARREDAGLCVRCGANVKGLSGACPKCGEPIPAA